MDLKTVNEDVLRVIILDINLQAIYKLYVVNL